MDTTVFGYIFWIVVLGVIVYGVIKGVQQQQKDKAEGVILRFFVSGSPLLRITDTELIEGIGDAAQHHPLAGLVARVEEGGTVNRRMTATRMVTLGIFAAAAPKKLDDREVYLTIEGPKTFILRQIQVKKDKNIGKRARDFAGRLNQLAKNRPIDETAGRPAVEPSAAPPAAAEAGPVAQATPATSSTRSARDSESSRSIAEELRALSDLHAAGGLTDEEFMTAKRRVIGGGDK